MLLSHILITKYRPTIQFKGLLNTLHLITSHKKHPLLGNRYYSRIHFNHLHNRFDYVVNESPITNVLELSRLVNEGDVFEVEPVEFEVIRMNENQFPICVHVTHTFHI